MDAVNEIDAPMLTEAVRLLDITKAKANWPKRAQGTQEERSVGVARLLALASNAGGEIAVFASTIACDPELGPESEDDNDEDDEDG